MDGVRIVHVIRQIRIVRFVNNLQPDGAQQPLEPPAQPNVNNRCLNVFLLMVIYAIGIGSIVLGATHLNDCPAEKMLPMGLIIFGGMLMVARILNVVYDFRSICEEECNENVPPCIILLNFLFFLADFGMFIALCVWAFSINPTTKPEDHDLKNYCDSTIYKTSFYGCIVGLIFYVLPISCVCGIAACRSC